MSKKPDWLVGPLTGLAERTRIGIALCATNTAHAPPQLHTGLVYWDEGQVARLLHLAFHAALRDEELSTQYLWSEVPINSFDADVIAGYCRRVGRRPPSIPYGIVYEGGRLADDGSATLSGQAVGLTCATFVLAILESFKIRLLNIETWTPREDDNSWHGRIVESLRQWRGKRPDLVSEEHIAAVAREVGCVRFRPEEVAAAAGMIEEWPVHMSASSLRGLAAREYLMALRDREE